MKSLQELFDTRQSVYKIGKNTSVTLDEIVKAVEDMAQELPSAFNSQTTRYIIASGQSHEKLWQTIYDVQKEVLDSQVFEQMESRFLDAKEGLGTVLLFESRKAVESMPTNERRAHLYKENNHAIAALGLWLTLTDLGLGVSLQHHNIGYEEGFDQVIRDLFDLDKDFELLAQMPFGSIESPAMKKERIAKSEQVQYFN